MGSRLDRITDWEDRARVAGYQAAALARSIGATPRHLQRYLLRRFGVSPRDWLRQLQMADARRLLDNDQLVKEAAHQVGFQNSTHFSRAFRRQFGMNPASYVNPSAPSSTKLSENGP